MCEHSFVVGQQLVNSKTLATHDFIVALLSHLQVPIQNVLQPRQVLGEVGADLAHARAVIEGNLALQQLAEDGLLLVATSCCVCDCVSDL